MIMPQPQKPRLWVLLDTLLVRVYGSKLAIGRRPATRSWLLLSLVFATLFGGSEAASIWKKGQFQTLDLLTLLFFAAFLMDLAMTGIRYRLQGTGGEFAGDLVTLMARASSRSWLGIRRLLMVVELITIAVGLAVFVRLLLSWH